MDGKILAHGGKPALVGKGPDEIRDSGQKTFIVELVQAAKTKSSAKVDYKFENPASLEVGKVIFCAGG
ncbi:MAG: cache domain-containing protein [Desulfobulbus sp.]